MKNNLKFTLPNLGNTCYLNSAVQCLLGTTVFNDYVLNTSFNPDTILDCFQKFGKKVLILEETDTDNDNDTYWNEYKTLVTKLSKSLKNSMDIYRQNDLGEFLNLFIDYTNNEVSRKINMSRVIAEYNNLDDVNSGLLRLRRKCNMAWINNFKNEYSCLVPMFYSLLISQISCGCGKIHHNYEFFNIIQVDIPNQIDDDKNERMGTLTDNNRVCLTNCIDDFMRSFKLNDASNHESIEWKCDVCNKKVLSRKSFTFWKLPKILIFNIKRFVFNEKAGDFMKLNTEVSIPEIIDMKKWTLCDDRTCDYRLKSIGCHVGRLNFGHYYTFVRRSTDVWVKIDDDTESSPITFDELLKHNVQNHVYVCFYERI